MSDGFSLNDALAGQTNVSGQQSQGQDWNNPWGGQNPGQQFPGQQYPGFPGPGGQQYPGFPGPGGQQYPGFPGPGGQQYPGFPGPGGQQYPGAPGYPGAPPTAPQTFPGAPTPGQPQPSAPAGPLRVPYDLPLPSGLVPRTLVNLQLVISPNGKRFVVDFKKGQDIAFHFNPRFDENPNVIVRNSMIRGQWGSEERQAPFPFKQGQPCTLQIFFDQDQFNVSVNNQSICQYKHRVRDFADIKTVSIGGDITLNGATATVV